MSKLNIYDPLSTEIQSPLIAGMIESLSYVTDILNLQTETYTERQMTEVYIGDDDRYRIYQAPQGSRQWLTSPAPTIFINDVEKTPSSGYFEIDYIGGSVTFQENHTLTINDVVKFTATGLKSESTTLAEINAKITTVEKFSKQYKESFETETDLRTRYATANADDFAIVLGTTNAVYVWSTEQNDWVNTQVEVSLDDYYDKSETNNLLSTKEPSISPQGTTTTSDNFYYGGRKQWIDVYAKARTTTLTGLSLLSSEAIVATDSILVALGKLQAQVNGKEPSIGAKGTAFNKSFGNSGSTVCEGNDLRLSNSRPANGGTADTAGKLTTARNIELVGDITGIVSFDGSGDVEMTTTNTTGCYSESVTLTTTWTNNEQSVTVSGVTENSNVIIGLNLSNVDSQDDKDTLVEEWNKILKTTGGDNSITFIASETPTVAIPINIMYWG